MGNYYEVTGSTITKYYYAGSQRIAMRQGSTLYYLLGDHLGSTSLTTDASGNIVSQMKYTAWGEVRYSSGTSPTDYTYTGQKSYTSSFGLMYYNARWYDSAIGRFTSADSIVPGGVQGYDRYAYSNNNPLRFIDPTGHVSCSGSNWDDGPQCLKDVGHAQSLLSRYGITLDNWRKADAYNAYDAIVQIAGALGRVTGKGSTAIFKDVFGPMKFTMDSNDSGKWHCAANAGGFGCTNASGKIDGRIIAHELAHVFRNRYFGRMGKTTDVDLYSVIGNATITDEDGNYVSGVQNGTWERTFQGYKSNGAPDVYHGSKEWDDWNSTGEEFADMFMNWVYDSFSADNAGAARYKWMNDSMITWMKNFP